MHRIHFDFFFIYSHVHCNDKIFFSTFNFFLGFFPTCNTFFTLIFLPLILIGQLKQWQEVTEEEKRRKGEKNPERRDSRVNDDRFYYPFKAVFGWDYFSLSRIEKTLEKNLIVINCIHNN